MKNKKENTITKIKNVLKKIRPFIQKDGGDLIFDSFTNGIVYIKILGSCIGCKYINITIKNNVKKILLEEIPKIKDVKIKM